MKSWAYLSLLGGIDPTEQRNAAAVLLTMVPSIALVARHELFRDGKVSEMVRDIAAWIPDRTAEACSEYSAHKCEPPDESIEQRPWRTVRV